MSDQSQGPGWWLASDGRWYPPESAPQVAGSWSAPPPAPIPPPTWGTPPPGYGYAYGPSGPAWGGPALPSANGMCVASMVLGIVSIVALCLYFIGAITAIIGLAIGLSALRRMNRGEVTDEGRSMAVAGVVCSAIVLGLVLLVIVFFVIAAASDEASAVVGGWAT